MHDSSTGVPDDLQRDLAVVSIRSTIVDVPTVRRHQLSSLAVTAQSYVIVELRLGNGVEGVGEAATLGGPRWSEESVESIKSTIDSYLAPALLGAPADRFEAARTRMDAAAKRNNAAKAAIESALFDAVGKTLGVRAVQLLGGIVRESMPVLWTLASGDPAQEIEEAKEKLAARLHDKFKVKIGAHSPDVDLARLRRMRRSRSPRRLGGLDVAVAFIARRLGGCRREGALGRSAARRQEFGTTAVRQNERQSKSAEQGRAGGFREKRQRGNLVLLQRKHVDRVRGPRPVRPSAGIGGESRLAVGCYRHQAKAAIHFPDQPKEGADCPASRIPSRQRRHAVGRLLL